MCKILRFRRKCQQKVKNADSSAYMSGEKILRQRDGGLTVLEYCETVRLGDKRCTGILNANTSSACPMKMKPWDFVHTQCRKDIKCLPPRVLRSVIEQFDLKSKCLLCSIQ